MDKKLFVAILATSISGLLASSASAQNTAFNNNEAWIVMGFQGINGLGGSNVFEITLGKASTFRDATVLQNNIINIGTILAANFDPDGAGPLNWYDSTDLFFGLGTVTDQTNPPSFGTLTFNDPSQTVYLSKARDSVGNQLVANSTMATPTSGNLQSASGLLVSLQNRFEQQGTNGAQLLLPKTGSNQWEDQNPFSDSLGTQSTAYGFVTGGTQFQFGSGSFSYVNGAQEGALDLYRMQAVNDQAGQYGFGAANFTPEFQGIFTVDAAGNVDFIPAVPEPSSALLFGGTAALGLIFRRRRTVAA